MLVLSRLKGKTIRIGDDITVTVLDTRQGSVRLGITAPKDVPVHREEVYREIKRDAGGRTDAGRAGSAA